VIKLYVVLQKVCASGQYKMVLPRETYHPFGNLFSFKALNSQTIL